MSGTLEVTIIGARNLKNKDGLFGSNDPYTIVKIHHQKFKTEVKKRAGKECQWNQTFRFGILEKYTEMHLEVYDQDTVSDDMIGRTTIPLQGILQSNQPTNAWYTIGKGSKTHGEVNVMSRFQRGPFPPDFNPDAANTQDNVILGAQITGGVLAAGALAYGAKVAYDHYNKKEEHGPPPPGGGNQPGYASEFSSNSNSQYGGGSQYGTNNDTYGHQSQPGGYNQGQGGYNQGQSGYNQGQGGYNQGQSGYNQGQGGYGQNQVGYGQNQGGPGMPQGPNSGYPPQGGYGGQKY